RSGQGPSRGDTRVTPTLLPPHLRAPGRDGALPGGWTHMVSRMGRGPKHVLGAGLRLRPKGRLPHARAGRQEVDRPVLALLFYLHPEISDVPLCRSKYIHLRPSGQEGRCARQAEAFLEPNEVRGAHKLVSRDIPPVIIPG